MSIGQSVAVEPIVYTLREKFAPLAGTAFILPGESYDSHFVQEPSMVVESDHMKIYYTGGGVTGDDCKICLATSTNMTMANVTKLGPVVGLGNGGAPIDRQAQGGCAIKVGSNYYIYATNGYGVGGAGGGEDRCVYLYKSTTTGLPGTFTDLGKVIDISQISGATGCGNTAVYKEMVGGLYHMVVEAFVGSIWQLFHFTSSSLESGWTYANSMTSLQVFGGSMYGGAWIEYANSKWHIFYHYGEDGNLPTVLGYATSTDLITCTKLETPLKGIEATPYGDNTDQAADSAPSRPTFLGKTWLTWEYCKNADPFEAQIWLAGYTGTFEQLINRSIG